MTKQAMNLNTDRMVQAVREILDAAKSKAEAGANALRPKSRTIKLEIPAWAPPAGGGLLAGLLAAKLLGKKKEASIGTALAGMIQPSVGGRALGDGLIGALAGALGGAGMRAHQLYGMAKLPRKQLISLIDARNKALVAEQLAKAQGRVRTNAAAAAIRDGEAAEKLMHLRRGWLARPGMVIPNTRLDYLKALAPDALRSAASSGLAGAAVGGGLGAASGLARRASLASKIDKAVPWVAGGGAGLLALKAISD